MNNWEYAKQSSLVFKKGNYSVFKAECHGRYYLVSRRMRLAFKNIEDVEPDFNKWVKVWEKNAKKQINNLDYRIADLKAQQNEFQRIVYQ